MSRTMEPTEISVPPALARRVEKLARQERRTPTALLREMLKVYERHRKKQEREQEPYYTEEWVMNLVREVEEEDRLHPKTQEELDREDEELRLYGTAQAKKLGIKSKDIDRLIHEYRQERRNAGRS